MPNSTPDVLLISHPSRSSGFQRVAALTPHLERAGVRVVHWVQSVDGVRVPEGCVTGPVLLDLLGSAKNVVIGHWDSATLVPMAMLARRNAGLSLPYFIKTPYPAEVPSLDALFPAEMAEVARQPRDAALLSHLLGDRQQEGSPVARAVPAFTPQHPYIPASLPETPGIEESLAILEESSLPPYYQEYIVNSLVQQIILRGGGDALLAIENEYIGLQVSDPHLAGLIQTAVLEALLLYLPDEEIAKYITGSRFRVIDIVSQYPRAPTRAHDRRLAAIARRGGLLADHTERIIRDRYPDSVADFLAIRASMLVPPSSERVLAVETAVRGLGTSHWESRALPPSHVFVDPNGEGIEFEVFSGRVAMPDPLENTTELSPEQVSSFPFWLAANQHTSSPAALVRRIMAVAGKRVWALDNAAMCLSRFAALSPPRGMREMVEWAELLDERAHGRRATLAIARGMLHSWPYLTYAIGSSILHLHSLRSDALIKDGLEFKLREGTLRTSLRDDRLRLTPINARHNGPVRLDLRDPGGVIIPG